MKSAKPPTTIEFTPDPRVVDTAPLRALLASLSEAALKLDLENPSDNFAKFTTALIALTKTIRETELYNQGLIGEDDGQEPRSLEERLKGYYPSAAELAELRAELKQRLDVLAPRLMKDATPAPNLTDESFD